MRRRIISSRWKHTCYRWLRGHSTKGPQEKLGLTRNVLNTGRNHLQASWMLLCEISFMAGNIVLIVRLRVCRTWGRQWKLGRIRNVVSTGGNPLQASRMRFYDYQISRLLGKLKCTQKKKLLMWVHKRSMLIAGCKKGAHRRVRKEFPCSLPDKRTRYKRENIYTLHTSMHVQYNAETACGTKNTNLLREEYRAP